MDWHAVISVQQQTPDNDCCHFSISNVAYVLHFGHFFENRKNSAGSHTGSKWWPGDPDVKDDPNDPLSRWPNDPVPCLGWTQRRTVDLNDDSERHDDDGDEQVGDGERGEEEVGHVLQPFLGHDGGAQQRVAEHRGDHDQAQRHSAPLHGRGRHRRGGVDVQDGSWNMYRVVDGRVWRPPAGVGHSPISARSPQQFDSLPTSESVTYYTICAQIIQWSLSRMWHTYVHSCNWR